MRRITLPFVMVAGSLNPAAAGFGVRAASRTSHDGGVGGHISIMPPIF